MRTVRIQMSQFKIRQLILHITMEDEWPTNYLRIAEIEQWAKSLATDTAVYVHQ